MGEAMNVRSVLRECAMDLLETEPKVSPEHVVRCAYQRHGELFAEATEQMVLDAARRIAADIMRRFTEDEDENEQLTIPGLGFPSAICVVTPDGTYFVSTHKATLNELRAGRLQRVTNVNAAVAKLDRYDEGLDRVTPYMEADPDGMSVDDALAAMLEENGE